MVSFPYAYDPQGSGCHIHIDRLEPVRDFGGEDWMAAKTMSCFCCHKMALKSHVYCESNSIRMVKNVECTGGWPTSWTSFQDFHSANPPEVKAQTFSAKPWATGWSSNLTAVSLMSLLVQTGMFVQVSHPYLDMSYHGGRNIMEHQSTLAQHNITQQQKVLTCHAIPQSVDATIFDSHTCM